MNDTHPLTLVLERTDLAHVRAVLNEWEDALRGYIKSGQPNHLVATCVRDEAFGAYRTLTALRLYGLAGRAYKISTLTKLEAPADD